MTGITVQPSGQACGAYITGVDLSKPLDADTINEIRAAWIEHHVVAFPDQHISDNDLERITQYFGNLGDEPFFVPIDGSDHVVALTRRADEKAPVFAEVWHSDWSFQDQPPIGTCLYSLVIPPVGGDTGFINQEKALADMPSSLRSKLEDLKALHSAAGAYSPEGAYGEKEKDSDRSMKILFLRVREISIRILLSRCIQKVVASPCMAVLVTSSELRGCLRRKPKRCCMNFTNGRPAKNSNIPTNGKKTCW